MGDLKLGIIETRFAEIVWRYQPITTKELVDLCAEELNWKRTTTYTVLKKLCNLGIFALNDRTVTALMSRTEYFAIQSKQFVDENFKGSLPSFLVAFGSGKQLSNEEINELLKVIDGMRR